MSAPSDLPGAAMERLRALEGDWTFRQVSLSGEGAEGSSATRRGPGGFSLLTQEVVKGPVGVVAAHGVLTWDPEEQVYVWYWTDSRAPGVVVLTGTWEDDLLFEGRDDRFARSIEREVRFFNLNASSYSVAIETREPTEGLASVVTRLYVTKSRRI